jgi:hypothetical protein
MKPQTGALASNTTHKTQGNTLAAAPKQNATPPKGNTVAAPKQGNQTVARGAGTAAPVGNHAGNMLAKAVQPIKAAGNLSFVPKGGQAKSAPVPAQKPAAKPSFLGQVAHGAKTVANFSKGGGGKKK